MRFRLFVVFLAPTFCHFSRCWTYLGVSYQFLNVSWIFHEGLVCTLQQLTFSSFIAAVRRKTNPWKMTLQLKAMPVRIWQRRKPLIFNRCHPFLLVKVCHMLLKGGLIMVIYGAGKWEEGQTRLAIFMIDTFVFQDLFRALLARQGASKASLLLSGILNQIFPTWKLKNSFLYLAGRFPQISELVQKVSPKQFLFIPMLLFYH